MRCHGPGWEAQLSKKSSTALPCSRPAAHTAHWYLWRAEIQRVYPFTLCIKHLHFLYIFSKYYFKVGEKKNTPPSSIPSKCGVRGSKWHCHTACPANGSNSAAQQSPWHEDTGPKNKRACLKGFPSYKLRDYHTDPQSPLYFTNRVIGRKTAESYFDNVQSEMRMLEAKITQKAPTKTYSLIPARPNGSM